MAKSCTPPYDQAVSLFDDEEFSRRLFFPHDGHTPPPPRAYDDFVEVDGARLHVRTHRAPHARLVVLLFHGNGEVASDWDGAAPGFAALGATLVAAEVRGYGLSTGEPSLRRMIADAGPTLDHVRAQHALPLVVMGRSLGSAAAHALFADASRALAGVILESGFADLRAFVARRGLPVPAAFDPQDVADFDPRPKLARGTCPLLVLHGAADTLISPDEARLAYATATTAEKRLVLVPRRGHNDLGLAPEYGQALATFLTEVVPPP